MADRNLYIKQIDSDFMTPSPLGTVIDIPSVRATVKPRDNISTIGATTIYSMNDKDSKITVTDPNNEVTTLPDTGGTFTFKISGQYVIRYMGSITRVYTDLTDPTTSTNSTSPFSIAFHILVVANQQPLPKWNIRMVIERVLDVAEPHKESEKPRYKLDPKQAEEFEKIEAPEFAFTGLTLREILDQIGGYIHGMARLVRGESGEFDTIRYDMLGGTEKTLMTDVEPSYIRETHNKHIEDSATALDSTVDNFVCSLDSDEGTIAEPYAGGYKSVRSEQTYARLTEGNIVIHTELPIYMVQKLTVKAPNGVVGDITGYVFEGSDYGRLSSYEGSYPTSKAFAVYYELGQKDIKGLSFKSPNVLGGALAQYSITNIIKAATGYDISADWWAWSKDSSKGNYPLLEFNIEYTPIFAGRVQMHKAYHEPNEIHRALFYNQASNLIETRYYGENLKGTLLRIGNWEMTRTYREWNENIKYIPKVGQLWEHNGEEYYITAVTIARYAEWAEWTVIFSKDFNRISQYIGINSQWRAYEVSQNKAYDRDIVYSDYAVIGDTYTDNKQAITGRGVDAISKVFSNWNGMPATAAAVKTLNGVSTVSETTLPVISTAFGNVLSFIFGFEDNYSAGVKSVADGIGEVNGYWQTDVRYTDYYGRFDNLAFELHENGLYDGIATALELPQGNHVSKVTTPFVKIAVTDAIVCKKDSNERIRFNYEVQFVTTLSNIIIGSALTRRCPLVRRKTTSGAKAQVYILPDRISKFADKIDLGKATQAGDLSPLATDSQISFGSVTPSVDGNAWAIAIPETGEILIACNTQMTAETAVQLPRITFTHKLR